jgi:lysophospholipase L1-like esterase
MRWAWVMGVVALVAAGVVVWVQRSEAKPTGPVAIVGDSITFLSTGAYRDELEPQYQPLIKGVLGITVAGMEPAARRMAAQHPRQAVIELGTNDVLHGHDLAVSEASYRKMVDAFARAGVSCIHAVNIDTRMRPKGSPLTAKAEEFNQFLDELAHSRGDVVVVDWNGAVNASSERRQRESSPRLISDTVHPTPEGSHVLAQLIHDSLDGNCSSGFF